MSSDTVWSTTESTRHAGQLLGFKAARPKQDVVAATKATMNVMRLACGNLRDGGDTASGHARIFIAIVALRTCKKAEFDFGEIVVKRVEGFT